MKNKMDNRVLCVLLYVAYIFLSHLLFAGAYCGLTAEGFARCLVYSFNPSLPLAGEELLYLVSGLQSAVDGIVFAVFTSLLVHFVMCQRPQILFSDHLIVRKRTTDGALSLSLMIANRDRPNLYDVKCHLTYSYIKDSTYDRNGETHFVQSIPVINNFYRFSFDLFSFPENLLVSLLERPEAALEENRVYIVLTGKAGSFNEDFLFSRTYLLRDIVIAKETKSLIDEHAKRRDGKIPRRLNWSNLQTIVPYSEEERAQVVCAIRDHLRKSLRGRE